MARSVHLFTIYLIMVLFLGCGKPYTYDDNGKTIELGQNNPFQIVLEGDNSPGFNWELAAIPEFITLQKTDKVEYKGRIRDYIFSFKTTSSGEGVVKLVYTDGHDIKRNFQITVFSGPMTIIASD